MNFVTTILLFGSLFLFIFLGLPIGIAIGLACLVTIVFATNLDLSIILEQAFSGINSTVIMAIPFFMFAWES